MSTVATAIRLKHIIDNIPNYSTRIGYSIQDIDKFKGDHDAEVEDEEGPDDRFATRVLSQINEILAPYQRAYFHGKLRNGTFQVKGQPYVIGKVTEQEMKEWYSSESATTSGFGNVHELQTQVDPLVRKAREISGDDVSVDPDVLTRIETLWQAKLYPRHVRAQFDKMNLYTAGGKFEWHKDTPDRNLLGTCVVCVGDTTGNKWNSFSMGDKKVGLKPGTILLFFTDVPHRVEEIDDGWRATLTFKLFAREEQQQEQEEKEAQARLQQVLGPFKKPFGLRLSHEGSRNDTVFKAGDEMLLRLLKSIPGTKCLTFPIVSVLTGTWDDVDSDSTSCTSEVYPIHDAVMSGEKEPDEILSLRDIPFFDLNTAESVVWKRELNDSAEFTGNESRPGDENSMYVHFGVVMIPMGNKRKSRE